MGGTFLDTEKETQQEESSQFSLNKDIVTEKDSDIVITEHKIKKWARWVKAEQTVASDSEQEHIAERCIREVSPQRRSSMDLTIPKHAQFVSVDAKYLLRCLDFLEFKSSDSPAVVCSQAISCGIAVNLKHSQMRILLENLGSHKNGIKATESGSIFYQFPSTGVLNGNKNVGGITKGLLPYHLGELDNDMNTGRAGKIDVKETGSNFTSSPSEFIFSSLQKPETERTRGNGKYGLKSLHKRHASILSVNSSCSDRSASPALETVSQGMLHCTWKSGIPYFVFSVDDQREVYTANLLRIESPDYKNIDYMYLFHSKASGQRGRASFNKCDLVGKMKVSSSLTLCSDNSKVVETEFILSGTDEKSFGNMLDSGLTFRKNKGSPMKVVDVFRKKHLLKHRSDTKFGAPTSVPENLCDSFQDMSNRLDAVDGDYLLENSPNLELAAVIVKDQCLSNYQEKTVGGWGLKFLEKSLAISADTSREASTSSDGSQESCLRNSSDCSTSATVILPADFHGGPKTRNGGPSGLIERWQSGGHCDCGGWDIGCPLTILTNKSMKKVTTQADSPSGGCKSFDLVTEGAKQGGPSLKMVNVHDGEYVVHFQSTLSALQSFSIAVARIHAESPSLTLKNSKKLRENQG